MQKRVAAWQGSNSQVKEDFFSKHVVGKLGFCRCTSQRCRCIEVDFVSQQVNGAREKKKSNVEWFAD